MFAYTKLMQAMAAAGVVSTNDPYFNLTTLLLNTTATNGAQNNTFLDSSTNNFTITRNGNTTQGTFTPFSQTGWGNYFNGSSYLNTSSLAAMPSDFTVEGWVYVTSTSTSRFTNGAFYLDVIIATGSNMKLQFYDGATVSTDAINTFPINTWAHVAVVRSGSGSNNCSFYVNGVRGTQFTCAASFGSSAWQIGALSSFSQYFYGYISNLRFCNSAVYTGSSFTPSTTPLTTTSQGASSCILLTCQSNRFLDNSSTAATFTTGGTPSVQAFSPFLPTTAYSTSVVGGSGYFDGSGDYLTTTSGTSLGSGNFTIEAWVYLTAAAAGETTVGSSTNYYTNGFNGNFVFRVGTTNLWQSFDGQGSAEGISGSYTWETNTWTHVAWVRSGSTLTVYKNGVSIGSGTVSKTLSDSANGYSIGAGKTNGSADQAPMTGYISGLRTVVGTAVYTATFTPPTAPLTAITNTSLLLSGTNAGIFDSAAKNVLETVGNAQVSTTQAKWGTTSMYFDGTGDNLSFPSNNLYNFGSSDFTIEFWFYPPSISYGAILYSTNNGSKTDVFAIYSYGSGQSPANSIVSLVTASGGGAWSLFNNQNLGSTTAATWQHVALVRNGSTFKGYINGVAGFTVTSSSAIASFNGFSIASNGASGDYLTGYIDDLRITRYARYTADFTPPTAAFPLQ